MNKIIKRWLLTLLFASVLLICVTVINHFFTKGDLQNAVLGVLLALSVYNFLAINDMEDE